MFTNQPATQFPFSDVTGNCSQREELRFWSIDAGKVLRDWSLITGRGGYKTGGGAREVLPLRKRGAEKVLAMLKGGHKKFWGSFYTVA